jgi:hypothetical protein
VCVGVDAPLVPAWRWARIRKVCASTSAASARTAGCCVALSSRAIPASAAHSTPPCKCARSASHAAEQKRSWRQPAQRRGQRAGRPCAAGRATARESAKQAAQVNGRASSHGVSTSGRSTITTSPAQMLRVAIMPSPLLWDSARQGRLRRARSALTDAARPSSSRAAMGSRPPEAVAHSHGSGDTAPRDPNRVRFVRPQIPCLTSSLVHCNHIRAGQARRRNRASERWRRARQARSSAASVCGAPRRRPSLAGWPGGGLAGRQATSVAAGRQLAEV